MIKMLNMQTFYKFLSRMPKREKLIFYGAILFVSLALLDRLIIYPISSKMTSLDKEIQQKESDIKKDTHILALKDRILKESAKYASFFSGSESKEEEIASLLKEVENLANKTSVYLIDIKPGSSRVAEGPNRYFVKLNCEAQMEQIANFMHKIESSNKLLTIEKYRISPRSKESSIVACRMSVSKTAIAK